MNPMQGPRDPVKPPYTGPRVEVDGKWTDLIGWPVDEFTALKRMLQNFGMYAGSPQMNAKD